MNEEKIVYRKEYVDNAIELIRQALEDLEESASIIDEKIQGIIQANEFPYVEQKNKNLLDIHIEDSLRDITIETEENLKLLENASLAMENYGKEEVQYTNPLTGSPSEQTIKNGSAIAALAGIATVGAATLLAGKDDEEKTES